MTDEETWDFHQLVNRLNVSREAAESLATFIDDIIGRVDEEGFDRGCKAAHEAHPGWVQR